MYENLCGFMFLDSPAINWALSSATLLGAELSHVPGRLEEAEVFLRTHPRTP